MKVLTDVNCSLVFAVHHQLEIDSYPLTNRTDHDGAFFCDLDYCVGPCAALLMHIFPCKANLRRPFPPPPLVFMALAALYIH